MKKKDKVNKTNNTLLNVIAPMGLSVKRNGLEIGENMSKVYGIVKYPKQVEYGWLAKITNIPNTVVGISFKPIDNSGFIESLSRNITINRATADGAKDPLTQQRAEQAAIDGEKMLMRIDQQGETVGLMEVAIMPMARDENQFQKTSRRVESIVAMCKCKARVLANLQMQAFKSVSPYYTGDETIEEVIGRVLPLSTFVGGFPFSSSGYNDGCGYYFAKDSSGGLIVLDPWKRGDDRTNTNMVVTGVAGVGKSTVVKHIIESEYMKGTKILLIDPEREYEELCKNLGGDWINAGGGSNGMLNPLQIRPTPRDEEDEFYVDEGNGIGDLALHIKNLEIFFNLYIPSLSEIQKALLKQCLIELYEQFGITWDTNVTAMKNSDFPRFIDLYKLLEKKRTESEKVRKAGESNPYTELALLFTDIATGSDSFLWNGHTSIETKTRCVCLDTHDLQSTPDNIKRTQYFNLLTWCWQQMTKDREEKVLLICDEAYLMVDPNVPQSLVFLRNAIKRDRKYEAGIVVIFHSVVDVLDPKVKMYGQALLDIPTFKIIMGTDGKNLQETKSLYNLTDAEEELLASKKRANALLVIGSKRLHAIFEIPEYKLRHMGKAGGR